MNKLNLQTTNIVDENIKKIAELFPNCLTERLDEHGKPEAAIDFDMLRQELSKDIVEGPTERYQFTWPDKRNAIRLANTTCIATLRPCKEDETKPTGADSNGNPYCSTGSVNFDTTQNLYIEGDNLQVLKLLREVYLGKVDIIYIDPPYNTGSDFVYNDDYSIAKQEYIHNSGQTDTEGHQLVVNTESNGRFHTDWLNMIYPRLKIARDLLSDIGVIFISIDDNEVANLKKVCDEIFGENNFVAKFDWRKKTGANDAKDIAVVTESILLYAKCRIETLNKKIWRRDEDSIDQDRYKYEDEFVDTRGKFYYDTLDRGGLQYSDSMNFGIEAPDGGIIYPNGRNTFVNDGWIWKWSKEKVKWGIEHKFLEFVKSNKSQGSSYTIKYKVYQNVDNEGNIRERAGRAYMNLISEPINQIGNSEMKAIFDNHTPFSNPKPVGLIKYLFKTVKSSNALILDFFSGSSSSAETIMRLNAEDEGKRRFIMVQLPEVTADKSDAKKMGYNNICEIGKDRIRKAAIIIKKESPLTTQHLDIGFRVLKLDSSNMEDVYYRPEDSTDQTLFEDNIKHGRSSEDLLFQVMLECNLPLSAKIETEKIAGKEVFSVNEGYLIACFDEKVNENVIKEVAKRKPYYFVMRDSSLATDNVADNFEQIWQAYSKDTIRRIL